MTSIDSGGSSYRIFKHGQPDAVKRLPYSLKILLENLLRHKGGGHVQDSDIEALVNWDAQAQPSTEIAFVPSRVLLQDFTGVPAIVDLAAMRDAMAGLGGDVQAINPQVPVELVIDHSVMVDTYGSKQAVEENTRLEVARNLERYRFLRWGQKAFRNFKVVPPGTGIVHQVNLEFLARGVMIGEQDGQAIAYPDTLVGTDSHTTMINGLGVLGWGVGGIEAEAAMLGQPISMLIPQVVGFELKGAMVEGATATDLVLVVTEMLRAHGVVGKFVEFFGDGLAALSLADRATIANMAPEYGATCGIFPVDQKTLDYLRLTGREDAQVQLVEDYAKAMGFWPEPGAPAADYSAKLTLELGEVAPCIAGPKRPQDRIPLDQAATAFAKTLSEHQELRLKAAGQAGGQAAPAEPAAQPALDGRAAKAARATQGVLDAQSAQDAPATPPLEDGAVVIAAITSCTNTSNPAVLVAAGLLARKARAHGLTTPPWVKTSLAPGSKAVTDYLDKAGLLADLEALGFYLVGYGCTTCIGNSGPLAPGIEAAIEERRLLATAVLSGNRNFEGRIHPQVRANYLASPPLVVAYALAGNLRVNLAKDALGTGKDGQPITLKDLWPSAAEVEATIAEFVTPALFREKYADVYHGNPHWNELSVTDAAQFDWPDSTYVKEPPYFAGLALEPPPVQPIQGARCLVKVGDSITTDHISPAGSISEASPAGEYLSQRQIAAQDFNSYGSRRGNHEVMMRGTFANVRLRNQLAPGTEGSWTRHHPSGEQASIFAAAESYRQDSTPLVVLAGAEYGTGSSRDWAAKGPALLGVKAVLAASYERIHRSNLVGMGVLPLQFKPGENAETHGLTGDETFDLPAIAEGQKEVEVSVNGGAQRFAMDIRIDTPSEFSYYQHGGILQFVLRKLRGQSAG